MVKHRMDRDGSISDSSWNGKNHNLQASGNHNLNNLKQQNRSSINSIYKKFAKIILIYISIIVVILIALLLNNATEIVFTLFVILWIGLLIFVVIIFAKRFGFF